MFTLEFVVPKSNGEKESWLTIITPQQHFGNTANSRQSSLSRVSTGLLQHNSSMMNLNQCTDSMKCSRLLASTTTPFGSQKAPLMRQSFLKRDSEMTESKFISTDKENSHNRKESVTSSVPSTPTEVITRESLIHKLGAVDRSSRIRLF